MPLDRRQLTCELHRMQTKHNQEYEAVMKMVAEAVKKTNDMEYRIRLMCILLRIIGVATLIFGVFKDSYAEAWHWNYQPGFGWQQILVIILGFFMLLVTTYMPKEEKNASTDKR